MSVEKNNEITVKVSGNFDKVVEINDNLEAPIEQDAVVGKISYEVDGETFSTDLIASNSAIASNFETIIFRASLIFLILLLLVIILKKINKPRKPRSSNYSIKHDKKTKRVKSKKGGRYKFTRIK